MRPINASVFLSACITWRVGICDLRWEGILLLRPGGSGRLVCVGCGAVGERILLTKVTTVVLATYGRGARAALALSNLSPMGFRAAIGSTRARLCALGGGTNVRMYVAGFKKHVMSVVMPSGGKIVRSMMLNFSDVTSCVGVPDSFNTSVKHCTGQVGRKGVILSKSAVRLPRGGFKRYLRNNPGK